MLSSEVEQLRAQLAAAQERERELSEALSSSARSSVKAETMEPSLPLVSPRAPAQALHKSGASLGLMVGALLGLSSFSGPSELTMAQNAQSQVLLCALPSLLALQGHSAMQQTSFSLPMSNAVQAASAYDMHGFIPGDYDWFSQGGQIMDLDLDHLARMSSGSASANGLKKLEFVDGPSEALGLSGLDISFDATPSQDGKIRVRIHPPASTGSDTQSNSDDDQSMWSGSEHGSSNAASPSHYSSDADQLGPFLTVGDYGMGSNMAIDSTFPSLPPYYSQVSDQSSFDYMLDNSFSSASSAGRRRVRIALKSMPGQGREGGEWEVELC